MKSTMFWDVTQYSLIKLHLLLWNTTRRQSDSRIQYASQISPWESEIFIFHILKMILGSISDILAVSSHDIFLLMLSGSLLNILFLTDRVQREKPWAFVYMQHAELRLLKQIYLQFWASVHLLFYMDLAIYLANYHSSGHYASSCLRGQGPAPSIGPNWVASTWTRRQNPVSEKVVFLNKTQGDGKCPEMWWLYSYFIVTNI
jgi:hypothetical protein